MEIIAELNEMKRRDNNKLQIDDSNNAAVGKSRNFDALGRQTNTVVRPAKVEGVAIEPNFVQNNGQRCSETTTYPLGLSDYSIHVDRRGLRTVSSERHYIDRSESVTQTFHPTNTIIPVTISTNTMYRNGQSISERHWDDQWIQDIQSSRYLENGDLEQMSITVSPDCGTVTNHVSLMDFLGRSVCIVTPLGTTSNLYGGASSRLVSTTRFTPSTSSTSTYLYDDMGAQVGQSQNGIASLSDMTYEFVSNEWWRVTSQSTFCNGVTNSFSVSREQLTGLSNALRRHSFSTSPDGVTTHAFASFNPSTGILTETTESDTRSQVIRRKKFGRVIETESPNGRFYNYFEPYGRVFLTRRSLPGDSGRKATTYTGYNNAGDISESGVYKGSTTDWVETGYTHDPFGQRVATTDSIGGIETSVYDNANRLIGSSGTVYPVKYGYDSMGRMEELRTTRDGSTFDKTRWTLDPVTGLATAKTYADDSTIAYSYTDNGKSQRTTWARGEWKEHAYDSQERLTGSF